MNKEIWASIEGYEGRYEISNEGRVKSLLHKEEKILIPNINTHGYYSVKLYDKNKNRKTMSVHRLVAIAFVNRDNNLNVVNHIDENSLNNYYKNLEWCTGAQNVNHGTCMKRMLETKKSKKNKAGGKTVFQYDKEGNLLNKFDSCADAGRATKVAISHICDCCNNKKKYKTAGGFIWKY